MVAFSALPDAKFAFATAANSNVLATGGCPPSSFAQAALKINTIARGSVSPAHGSGLVGCWMRSSHGNQQRYHESESTCRRKFPMSVRPVRGERFNP